MVTLFWIRCFFCYLVPACWVTRTIFSATCSPEMGRYRRKPGMTVKTGNTNPPVFSPRRNVSRWPSNSDGCTRHGTIQRSRVYQVGTQHPSAASTWQGDRIQIFNDRGECRLYAQATTDTQPGLLVAEGLHWSSLMPGGEGANQLTSQRLTDQSALKSKGFCRGNI